MVAGFASRNAGDRYAEKFPLVVTHPGLRLTSYRWYSPGILGGYAMTIRRILCTAGVLTVIGASLAGAPASAEKAVEDPLATLLSQPIETDIKASTLPGASRVADGSGLPSEILPAIAIAQSRRWGGAVNEIVWDRDKRELLIYAASKRAEITSALSSAKTTVPARVVPAVRSLDEIDVAVRKLVSDTGQLADGTQVAGWYPSYDGGEVTFEVAESSLRSRSLDLPRQVDGISMNFKFGITNTPTAPRIDNTPGVAGGALMQDTKTACTTGFPIIRSQDQEPGNLSADHCGSGMGEEWFWGTTGGTAQEHLVGVTGGQAYTGSGMGTDLELFVLGDSVTGSMAWGTNSSFWYYPINGYFAAVVGQHVCYNGAYSGSVCSNEVTGTNYQACYGLSLPCYRLTRTQHVLGTPAAGNGDSGGPVGITGARPSDDRFGWILRNGDYQRHD